MPGASLLPGLIDAHTHVLLHSGWNELELARQMVEENGHRAASAVQAMSISVRHGFTAIHDLAPEDCLPASTWERNPWLAGTGLAAPLLRVEVLLPRTLSPSPTSSILPITVAPSERSIP